MKSDFRPRLWQERALKALDRVDYSALVEAPTAAGKTVFAMMAIDMLRFRKPGLKTVIVVPTINLLRQWKKELVKFLDVPESEIGEFYGPKKDNSSGKKFMIYVINSASREGNLFNQQLENKFDFVIHDEVLHVGAETYKSLLKIEFLYKLGISATPDREYDSEGSKEILKYFGNRIGVPKEHVELAPMNFNMIRVELTGDEKVQYNALKKKLAVFLSKLKRLYGLNPNSKNFFKKLKELSEAGIDEAKAYVGTIRAMENIRFTAFNKLKAVRGLVNSLDKKTIIFCDRISFVEQINIVLKRSYPHREIFTIHSGLKKKEQHQQLASFKQSSNGILVAARIVDEGFDVPDASIGVLVSFTKTKRQSIQRDGRILRFMKGKVAKKYVFVIKDIDEEDYCKLLMKMDQSQKALKGTWLDFKDNTFGISEDFRAGFNLLHLNGLFKMEESL